ncbi:histone H3 [Cucumispora dikerogammari]|nr:histone H3 [Cucumispora dikerogammari]
MARTTNTGTFRPKRKASKQKTPPRQSTKAKRGSINTKASKSVSSQKEFSKQSSATSQSPKKATLSARTPTVTQASSAKSSRRRKSTVLKEIKYYQSNIINLVQRAPLVRTLKQILLEDGHNIQRFSASAIEVLHESYESFLVSAASSGNDLVRHAKRVTLMKKDLVLAVKLREMGPLYHNQDT